MVAAMQRYFFSLRIAALVVLAAILVASIDLIVNGWNVVHDPDHRLTRAEMVYEDGSVSAMREFADGYWSGRPDRDGTLRLLCGNGAVIELGYVRPRMHETRTVTADDCAAE